MAPGEIIGFWRAAGRRAWFRKDAAFDRRVALEFEATHHSAARGELAGWSATTDGALALTLLLDQFPRNIWRGSAHTFATDSLARKVARGAVNAGHDLATTMDLRLFFYLPFSHSEAAEDQALAVTLSEALERAGGESAESALTHRDIIARFGRFPHRNAALGRDTTDAEAAFLAGGGFAG
jgi:uncharacterized protein (DUF924 family)